MYCKECGNELPENAKFCASCGSEVLAEPAVVETQYTKPFSWAPFIAIGLACMVIGAGVSLVFTPATQAPSNSESASSEATPASSSQATNSSSNASDASSSKTTSVSEAATSSETTSTSEASAETVLSAEEQVLKNIEGWWVTVGNSQSVFYRFRGATMEAYYYDFIDNTGYHYTGVGNIASIKPLNLYPNTIGGTNGYSINLPSDNSFRYYYYDDQPDFLECHWSTDGYSVSDSLTRLTDVPADLASLGDQMAAELGEPTSLEQSSPTPDTTNATNTNSHVVAGRYEFDIPQYWRGRVDIIHEETDDRINIYPAGTKFRLITLGIEDAQSERMGGDIGSGNIWSQQLADGNFLVVRVATTGMFAGGIIQPYFSQYSTEQIELIADLMTNGDRTAEQLFSGDYGSNPRISAGVSELIDSITIKE